MWGRIFKSSKKSFNRKKIILIAALIAAISLGYLGKGLFVAALVNGMPISRLTVVKELEKQGGSQTLDNLVEPTAKGDPMRPLRWVSKSLRHLKEELVKQGFVISHQTITVLLRELEYSLQVNKKCLEKSSHQDRNSQFEYINECVCKMLCNGYPVISVDTKKKELLGDYKNNGRELCQKGTPVKVQSHDFPDKRFGKIAPYGVYDIGKNKGWISVGISSDTAEFAVNSIRTWWYKLATDQYISVKELLITADCGGSNGYRVKLWKVELQKFSDETGLSIHVRHFPPGTSKWNAIEHKLFSYISRNWRGKPLINKETVVNLIANTTTKTGLKVMAVLDENEYEKGREVSKEELSLINITGDNFHPEWNYTIKPRFC